MAYSYRKWSLSESTRGFDSTKFAFDPLSFTEPKTSRQIGGQNYQRFGCNNTVHKAVFFEL
jgi:hypothetical protein